MKPTGPRAAGAVLWAVAAAAVLGTGCAAESTQGAPAAAGGAVDGSVQAADSGDGADSAVAVADGAGDLADAKGPGGAFSCLVQPPVAGPVQKFSHVALAFDATGCDRTGDGVPDNALGEGLSQAGGAFNARGDTLTRGNRFGWRVAAPGGGWRDGRGLAQRETGGRMIGWGALGRTDHPWSAAVEQGCSTLPRYSGRLGEPSLPWETDGCDVIASLPGG